MPYLFKITKSEYNRDGIQSILDKLVGDISIKDAITQEVAIVSFDYNNH